MTEIKDNMDLLGNTTFSEFLIDKPSDDAPPAPAKTDDDNTNNAPDATGAGDDGASGNSGGNDAAAQEASDKAAEEEAAKAAAEAEKVAKDKNPSDDDSTSDDDTTDGDDSQDGDGGEPQIIDLIQENLGYEVEGTFENSVEGVTEYARKAIPKAAEQMVQQLFEEYPEAQQLINHLSQGNSLETFLEEQKVPDHLIQELTEDNVDMQKAIMVDQFTSTGMSKEDAEVLVQNLEDNGKLFPTAQNVHNKMQAAYKDQIEAKKQEEIEAQKQRAEQAKEHWSKIKGIVDKGDLGGIRIPQSKQGSFWDYLAKPVNGQNQTARDLRHKELTLEQQMMLEYIVFSDFKVGTSKKVVQDLNALRDSNNTRDNRFKGAQGKQDQPVNTSTSSLDGLTFDSFMK